MLVLRPISDNRDLSILMVFQTLCIGAFLLPVISIFPVHAVGLWTRVLVVGLGTFFFLGKGWLRFVSLSHPLIATALLWVLLCLTSAVWSQVPTLTLLKSLLAAGVFLCGALAGFAYGRRTGQSSRILQPLAMVGLFWAALTLLAILAGRYLDPAYGRFVGPTNSHNMYASAAGCFAFSTSEHLKEKIKAGSRLWKGLLDIAPLAWAGTIFLSGSRGGMLLFLIVAAVLMISRALNRRLVRGLVLAGMLLPTLLALGYRPIVERVDAFFYKEDVPKPQRDPFYSRRPVWEETMAAIALTGPMGAGFGVFADWHLDRLPLLTSVGYGREHGSAWLAVREQLGYPGQAAFLLLGLALLKTLSDVIRLRYRGACSPAPVLLAGIALGLYAVSFFEAWTVSPAAPESMIFWSSVGIAAGASVSAREALRAAGCVGIVGPPVLQPAEAVRKS